MWRHAIASVPGAKRRGRTSTRHIAAVRFRSARGLSSRHTVALCSRMPGGRLTRGVDLLTGDLVSGGPSDGGRALGFGVSVNCLRAESCGGLSERRRRGGFVPGGGRSLALALRTVNSLS